MTKHMKKLVAGAAFAGLVAGTAASAVAASKSLTGQDNQDTKTTQKKTEKHACKGKNSCKGKGGCATDGSKKMVGA